MSEFGNETSTAALRLGEKSIEALMKFFRFLLERKEKKINAQLKKEQLNDAKIKSGERIAKLKVQGKAGFVKAKLLQRTGEPLVAINIALNDKQMKDFARYAKKYGIPYTSISDQRKTGDKTHTFFVREKDLVTAKAITDRMTEDLQLKAVDDKIAEINSKAKKSEQDLADIEFLNQQKENIVRNGTRAFNNDNAEIIFNDVCGDMQDKSMSFDRGLNRFTDRDFSRDTPYYLCERTNPMSYIELKSSLDEFNGEEYTKTDYKVFKDNLERGEFTDKRFDGRPKGYWQNIRAEMKEMGGFTDDVVIFNTKAEFERYQELYKVQQREILVLEQGEEYRDYPTIIDKLKKQLEANKAEINSDGIVVDKESQKPLTEIVTTDIDEKMRVAESLVIGRQIENYDMLAKTEVKVAMDKLELESKAVGSEEHNALNVEIKIAKQRIKNGLAKEQKLIDERSQINGVQAMSDVDKEYVAEQEKKSAEKNADISLEDKEILAKIKSDIVETQEKLKCAETDLHYSDSADGRNSARKTVEVHKEHLKSLNEQYDSYYEKAVSRMEEKDADAHETETMDTWREKVSEKRESTKTTNETTNVKTHEKVSVGKDER